MRLVRRDPKTHSSWLAFKQLLFQNEVDQVMIPVRLGPIHGEQFTLRKGLCSMGLLYVVKWFNPDQSNFEAELVINFRRVDM